MGDDDSGIIGRIARIGRRQGSRRQLGLLGASLLAALVAPQAAGRGKKRSARGESQRRGHGARGRCGGFTGKPCPRGLVCVDDPTDDCDPDDGGADCGGICVPRRRDPCERIRCAEGTRCCPRCGGLCLARDIPCTGEVCRREPCSETVCGPGEFCCNESCSRCAPLGGACTDEVCPPPAERCGRAVCGEGEYCCNRSCGTCAPFGQHCHQAICDPLDPPLEECGPVACPPGQVCCNASCGICTPPGGACAMIACEEIR